MAGKYAKKQIKGPVAPNKKVITKKEIAVGLQRDEAKKAISLNMKLAALLGLIACIVYANTLRNGFVLDDYSVITANTIVTKGTSAIPELLTTPHMRGFFITAHDIYRPLSLVMFAVEYQFFGLNPLPFHLTNILLFAGCVVLLFLFLVKLFKGEKTTVAFIASLLFALHPIHTEVVANIKSRDELLCFFFAFSCLNIFIKYVQSGKLYHLLLGTCCFFLALLSKETVITFMAFIPFVFFFYRDENKTRSAYITAFIAIATIIFLVTKFEVLNFYNANQNTYINFIDNALSKRDAAPGFRTATAILILGYYIKLLLIPYPLICDYSFNTIPLVGFGNAGVLISLAAYIFLAVYGIRRFLNNHKDPYALGIFYYLVTMTLFTNILFLLGTTLGERLLFFPSVAFCLLIALLIEKWATLAGEKTSLALKNTKVLATIIPICAVYMIITFIRNAEWRDNYTLYTADCQKSPNNSKICYDLGHELSKNRYPAETDTVKKRQIFNESITWLKKAVQIYPAYEDANTELGATYFRRLEYDSAEVYFTHTLAINPDNTLGINNLAAVDFLNKKYDKAISLYRRAIYLKPEFIQPYANIGLCYQYTGKYDSAIYYLEKGITIDPKFKITYEILATTYKIAGKMDQARKYEAIAQKNNPGFKL